MAEKDVSFALDVEFGEAFSRLGTPQKIKFHIDDLLDSAVDSLRNQRPLPAMVLAYSVIDILGWLGSIPKDEWKVETRFVRWASTYLPNKQELGCTPIELYHARCGLIHTLTSVPGKKQKSSRRIMYGSSPIKTKEINEIFKDVSSEEDSVFISPDFLIQSIRRGLNRFLEDLERDIVLLDRADHRVRNFFVVVPEIHR